ncbi:hypothetical protein KW791_00200 [Candidatus Parcubacteria bacterium]|nr:hypothetical protein [Candidatus Parcubacteria bacterium]
MRNRKPKKQDSRKCDQCNEEFKPNSDGMTISLGEYLSTGMKWFCNETCSENYTSEHGF